MKSENSAAVHAKGASSVESDQRGCLLEDLHLTAHNQDEISGGAATAEFDTAAAAVAAVSFHGDEPASTAIDAIVEAQTAAEVPKYVPDLALDDGLPAEN